MKMKLPLTDCDHNDYNDNVIYVVTMNKKNFHAVRVGVREAKINLSKLLKAVQKNGVEIVITDRGKPVGKLGPVSPETLSVEERVEELERQGWIGPQVSGKHPLSHLPLPIRSGLAQKYLEEDRDSRAE
jgi:prevent-host-death family protein